MPKKKACEQIPNEIWRMILEWVIDSLLLFSTDPFEYDWHPETRRGDWTCVMHIVDPDTKEIWWGIKDRPAMSQFRATRAKLRLVCKAWKTFADSPSVEHRCMRLCMASTATDVLKPSTILKARRLEVLNSPAEGAVGLIASTIEQAKTFSTEIILDTGGMFTSEILSNRQHLFPHLRVLFLDLSEDDIPIAHIQSFDSLLCKLECLTCLIMHVAPFFPLPDQGLLRLPHLRTLSITCIGGLGELYMDAWVLPSLEHLELGVLPEPTESQRFLHRHGHNLRYLSLQFVEPPIFPSFSAAGVLHSCPRLLYLGYPLSVLWRNLDLQSTHPLLRLVNTSYRMSYTGFSPLHFFADVMRFCASTPRLQTITDSHSWLSVLPMVDQDPDEVEGDVTLDSHLFQTRKFDIQSAQAIYILASKLDSLGIRYEDGDSLTVDQGREKQEELSRDNKRARA